MKGFDQECAFQMITCSGKMYVIGLHEAFNFPSFRGAEFTHNAVEVPYCHLVLRGQLINDFALSFRIAIRIFAHVVVVVGNGQ